MICGREGILGKVDAKLDPFFAASASHVGPSTGRPSSEAWLAKPQSSSSLLPMTDFASVPIECEHDHFNDEEADRVSNTFMDPWTTMQLKETSEALDQGVTTALADSG